MTPPARELEILVPHRDYVTPSVTVSIHGRNGRLRTSISTDSSR